MSRFSRRSRRSTWGCYIAEPLERRRLLTTLTAGGTGNNDNIIMTVADGMVTVTVNNTPTTMSDALVTDVVINAGGGEDTVSLATNTDNLVQVNLGAGNDTINFATQTFNMNSLPAQMTIDGGPDADFYNVQDQSFSQAETYSIFSTLIDFERPTAGNIATTNLETLQFFGGSGGNTINVFDLASNSTLDLRAGNGTDEIEIGDVFSGLDVVNTDITVNGQNGNDELSFDDRFGATTSRDYIITAEDVSIALGQAFVYQEVEDLALACSNGNNLIFLRQLSFGVGFSIAGNDGDDRLDLGNFSRNLAFFSGGVDFNGGIGQDSLVADDRNGGSATENYLLTPTTLFTGAGINLTLVFGYQGVEDFELMTSSFPNIITLPATTTTSVDIDMGPGDDSLLLTNQTNTLSSLALSPFITGGDGNDTITAFDQANPNPQNYLFFAESLGGPGISVIVYDSTERFNLEAGDGDNRIFVDFDRNLSVGLNLRGGNDEVVATIVLPTVTAALTVDGGASFDTVVVNDLNNLTNNAFNVTTTAVTRSFVNLMTYGAIEQLTINAGSGNNQMDVSSTAANTVVRLNGGNGIDLLRVLNNMARPRLDGGHGLDNVMISNNASASTVGDQDFNTVTITGTGKLLLDFGRNTVTSMRTLIKGITGTIDVYEGTLLIDYDTSFNPLLVVRDLLIAGHNGGNWASTGITTFAAPMFPGTGLAFAEATDVFTAFPATFAGRSIDNTTILIRQTLTGDATLDRIVNLADFSRLATNFNMPTNRSSLGDFNFDGTTGLLDFAQLAGHFNEEYPPPSRRDSPASVFSARRFVSLLDDETAHVTEAIA